MLRCSPTSTRVLQLLIGIVQSEPAACTCQPEAPSPVLVYQGGPAGTAAAGPTGRSEQGSPAGATS